MDKGNSAGKKNQINKGNTAGRRATTEDWKKKI